MPRFTASETYPSNFALAGHFGAGDAHAVTPGDGPGVELFLHGGAGGYGVALGRWVKGDDFCSRGAISTWWKGRVWAQLLLLLLLCDGRGKLSLGVGGYGPADADA